MVRARKVQVQHYFARARAGDFFRPCPIPTGVARLQPGKTSMIRRLSVVLLAALFLAVPLRALAGMAGPCLMPGHVCIGQDAVKAAAAGEPCHDAHPGGEGMASAVGVDVCTLCGDCCMGSTGLPVPFLVMPGGRPSSDLLLPPVPGDSGFLPEGPERPPRRSVL